MTQVIKDQQTSYPIEAIFNKHEMQPTTESKEDTQTTDTEYQRPETTKEEEEHDHGGEDEGSEQDSEEELTQVLSDQETSYPIEAIINREGVQSIANNKEDTNTTGTEYEQPEEILKKGRKRIMLQSPLQDTETEAQREIYTPTPTSNRNSKVTTQKDATQTEKQKH